MSQEDPEALHLAYEAMNRGDLQGVVAYVAPDFEYLASGVVPDLRGIYHGPAGFMRFMEGFWGMFDDPRFEIHEVIENDDRVLVSLTMRARGRQSRAETNWSLFHVWTLRDGKALEAVGLRD